MPRSTPKLLVWNFCCPGRGAWLGVVRTTRQTENKKYIFEENDVKKKKTEENDPRNIWIQFRTEAQQREQETQLIIIIIIIV